MTRSLIATEVGHADAVSFLNRLAGHDAAGQVEVLVPCIHLLELWSVASRNDRVNPAALKGWQGLNLTLVSLIADDVQQLLAEHTKSWGSKSQVKRGADLEFLWVAKKHAADLVTTDAGLLAYGGKGVSVITPVEYLSRYP